MIRLDDSCHVRQALRPALIALAYRMLGDVALAQDVVQETWLRWHQRGAREIESRRAYLVTIATRLCLNELTSARARREIDRADRLPEPVDLATAGMTKLELLDEVSMAFLVVLERLSPVERAVLLLHDVFELPHAEIATLVERSVDATRKLLERARRDVASGRRMLTASREDHARLLGAFMRAASAGDATELVRLLAEDATLVTDGGGAGVGTARNLPHPIVGAARVRRLSVRCRAGRVPTSRSRSTSSTVARRSCCVARAPCSPHFSSVWPMGRSRRSTSAQISVASAFWVRGRRK